MSNVFSRLWSDWKKAILSRLWRLEKRVAKAKKKKNKAAMLAKLRRLMDEVESTDDKETADALAEKAKSIEEWLAPDLVLLEDFPRSLQMDEYSCGAQAAFAVLKYYGKARSIKNVTRELGSTSDGTDSGQLRRLFKRRGLRPVVLKKPTIKSLKKEINAGNPVIVSLDTDHWAPVYGYGRGCIFVADPALGRSLRCRHSKKRFRRR